MWGMLGGLAKKAMGWGAQHMSNAASAAATLFGEREKRNWQAGQADLTRNFSEKMRNTQWQATIADMEAAGINPAVAYSKGANASPSGAMASGAGDVASSAMQMIQQKKQLKLLDMQIKKTTGEAETAEASGKLAGDRSRYLRDRGTLVVGGKRHQSTPLWLDMVDAEIGSARAGATNMAAMADRNRALARIAGPMADLSGSMGQLLPILGLLTGGAGAASGVVRAMRGKHGRRVVSRSKGVASKMGARLRAAIRR